jgi:HEPN domain-containing protein
MPNRTYALEWINFAGRNLETAKLLFKEQHYTDIIAIEIHQTIEKTFKTILAYNGIKLPRSHNLTELYKNCLE